MGGAGSTASAFSWDSARCVLKMSVNVTFTPSPERATKWAVGVFSACSRSGVSRRGKLLVLSLNAGATPIPGPCTSKRAHIASAYRIHVSHPRITSAPPGNARTQCRRDSSPAQFQSVDGQASGVPAAVTAATGICASHTLCLLSTSAVK